MSIELRFEMELKRDTSEDDHLFLTGLKPKVHLLSDMTQEFGWPKILTEILPWLIYRRYQFFSQKIEVPSDIPGAGIPFHLSSVKENDIDEIMTLRKGFHDLDILRHRLREGHICFLGWNRERLIHIRWIFTHSVYLPYLHRTLVLRSGEVYGDETYTLPEFRRHGVLVHAGFLVRKHLKELGYRRIICAAASWNSFIQKYAERMKYFKVGEAGYLNLAGYKKFFSRGGIKELNSKEIVIISNE